MTKDRARADSSLRGWKKAEYVGHSLEMLERIAAACGVGLKLHAEKKPGFNREVVLV